MMTPRAILLAPVMTVLLVAGVSAIYAVGALAWAVVLAGGLAWFIGLLVRDALQLARQCGVSRAPGLLAANESPDGEAVHVGSGDSRAPVDKRLIQVDQSRVAHGQHGAMSDVQEVEQAVRDVSHYG